MGGPNIPLLVGADSGGNVDLFPLEVFQNAYDDAIGIGGGEGEGEDDDCDELDDDIDDYIGSAIDSDDDGL